MSQPLCITTSTYVLREAHDRPYLYLEGKSGARLLELFVPSAVHTTTGLDDTTALAPWTVREEGGETVLERSASSSVWREKRYRVRCGAVHLRFEIEVTGTGAVTDVHYFGGYCSAYTRWGSGYFWSGTRLARGFNPEPNDEEAAFFGAAEGASIDATGVPLPGKAGWFFTPPPYLFAFEGPESWLGFGVSARPGEHRYTDYRYLGQRDAFALTLAFDGCTRVDGRYTLPAIDIEFGADHYAVLARHAAAQRARGEAPDVSAGPRPGWWATPIYCGWGSQCHLAARSGRPAATYARQEHYERFIAALEANGVSPGIVVIDDKWQSAYGTNEPDAEKWPDLRGFVARQHAGGRRVLLWLKAWDTEGLPVAECVTNAAGRAVALDPTSQAFAARLRANVHALLSPAGLDADGFKLDFSARMPSGPGLRLAGDAWGLELMKRYLALLHGAMKATKPDALLMTHTPHPYLADTLDMIRLNDVNTDSDVIEAMTRRARIARIACPSALVDTDNWPMANRAQWRDYTRVQPGLGVPSLYFATHLDATGEPLEPDDYALVRETWDRHLALQGAREEAA